MNVIGLSGKSGTGKSYNAIELCRNLDIEALIDDGLLIYKNRIVAGTSAKKEATKVGAVKTALFYDDAHRDKIKSMLKELEIENLLILGTSDRMIEQIAERLELPEPSRIVQIESITTKEERDKAKKLRKKAGTHVIPAPTFQVKRQFSGYFLNPLSYFRRYGKTRAVAVEKTMVRPTYSYHGDFIISDKVISDIVHRIADTSGGTASVLWVVTQNSGDGLFIRVVVQAHLKEGIRSAVRVLQKGVSDTVEYMTAFNVLAVEVEIKGLRLS